MVTARLSLDVLAFQQRLCSCLFLNITDCTFVFLYLWVFLNFFNFCIVRIFMCLFHFKSIKCPLRSLQMATAEMDSFSPASCQESIKTSHINSAELW